LVTVTLVDPSGFSTVVVTVPSASVTVVSFVQVPATHGSTTSTTVTVLVFVSVVVQEDLSPRAEHVFVVLPSEEVSVVTVFPLSYVVEQLLPLLLEVHVGPLVIASVVVVVVVVVHAPLLPVTTQWFVPWHVTLPHAQVPVRAEPFVELQP
jgi:hypothetical protein